MASLDMKASSWFSFVLILLCSSPALTERRTVYFKAGGEVLLQPVGIQHSVTNIVWSFNEDLVCDWDSKQQIDVYNVFKDRVRLNLTSGELHISNMTVMDAGLYKVDINHILQSLEFETKLLNEVPKPEILVKPLSCGPGHQMCTLSCSGNWEGAEPVTIFWRLDEGPWKKDKFLVIRKEETRAKSYQCRITNPGSQQDSDAVTDPFARSTDELNTGVVVGVVCGVVLAAAAASIGILEWKKKLISKCWSALPCARGDVETAPEPATRNEMEKLNGARESERKN